MSGEHVLRLLRDVREAQEAFRKEIQSMRTDMQSPRVMAESHSIE
jgi:hypothetical protein